MTVNINKPRCNGQSRDIDTQVGRVIRELAYRHDPITFNTDISDNRRLVESVEYGPANENDVDALLHRSGLFGTTEQQGGNQGEAKAAHWGQHTVR